LPFFPAAEKEAGFRVARFATLYFIHSLPTKNAAHKKLPFMRRMSSCIVNIKSRHFPNPTAPALYVVIARVFANDIEIRESQTAAADGLNALSVLQTHL